MVRRPPRAEEAIDKSWLESYADAITLLMAFFVMLFAFSLVDEKKFEDFKLGVFEAFGKPNPAVEGGIALLEDGAGLSPGLVLPPIEPRPTEQGGVTGEVSRAGQGALAAELEAGLQRAGVSDQVVVEHDPRGLVLRFSDQVLFDSGRAVLKPQGAVALAHVAEVLRRIDNRIVVEGHTDDVPTDGTAWPSNWELSVTRATHVLRWLVEGRAVPAPRVSAAGYADTRPRASNLTAQGRSQNRRVEIVITLAEEAQLHGQDAAAFE